LDGMMIRTCKHLLRVAALCLLSSLACADPLHSLYTGNGVFAGSCFATGKHTIMTAAHCADEPAYLWLGNKWVALSVVSIHPETDAAKLYCPVPLTDRYKVSTARPQSVTIRGAFPEGYEQACADSVQYGKCVYTNEGQIATAQSNARVRPGFSGGPVVDNKTGYVVGILSCRSPFRAHGGFVHSADW
jgi:V8-like Glu-specific endopeptidase